MKTLRVIHEGTFVNDEKISSIGIDDFSHQAQHWTLKLGFKKNRQTLAV
ncbi:hypothetical protein [Lentilactobacillus parafarraginis]|nr:hypothetical protein [Lentilactobacillus parafarraginis]